MAYILCIETATTSCSVALCRDNKVIEKQTVNTGSFTHSESLHIFIEGVLKRSNLTFRDLDCIAVSKGPGSYTGLRIGVSAAKGLAFALDIPIVSIGTLEIMSRRATIITQGRYDFYVPMLDARRMEVYTATFDAQSNAVSAVSALIIDVDTFSDTQNDKKYCFFGDGMDKCRGLLDRDNFILLDDIYPDAQDMADMAYGDLCAGKFADTAYLEPFYLKDFVGGGMR